MNTLEREHLITDWIALHHLTEESEEYNRHLWAERKLSELTRIEPDLCWELILSILSRDRTERTLANLAAGPLEDLLSAHGERLIDRVEDRAQRDAIFRQVLGAVWQGDMSDNLWNKIRILSTRK